MQFLMNEIELILIENKQLGCKFRFNLQRKVGYIHDSCLKNYVKIIQYNFIHLYCINSIFQRFYTCFSIVNPGAEESCFRDPLHLPYLLSMVYVLTVSLSPPLKGMVYYSQMKPGSFQKQRTTGTQHRCMQRNPISCSC